jgi:succinate dehydrogenase / fumarate reductase cytochrome b subunit
MGILGTVLLIFISVHMSNFWYEYHWGKVPFVEYRTDLNTLQTTQRDLPAAEFKEYVKYQEQGVEIIKAKDLYATTAFAFKNCWLVALYLLGMAALSFHLIHGFQSAFQTFGLNHKKYMPLIKCIGVWGFGVLIPLAFAAMPLYFFFCK